MSMFAAAWSDLDLGWLAAGGRWKLECCGADGRRENSELEAACAESRPWNVCLTLRGYLNRQLLVWPSLV